MRRITRCGVIWLAAACASISPIAAQTLDVFNATANRPGYPIPDGSGKILVGGQMTVLDGQTRNLLGRVNSDGTMDSFDPGAFPTDPPNQVYCFGVQTDGNIMVGGNYIFLAAQFHPGIGRVNVNGAVENLFAWTGGGSTVDAIAIQPDGKILIAGDFTANEIQRTNLARFNPDGSLDTTFNSSAGRFVRSMALQPDGKILLAGDFTNLAGQFCSRIGRLNTNGTLDITFNSGSNS